MNLFFVVIDHSDIIRLLYGSLLYHSALHYSELFNIVTAKHNIISYSTLSTISVGISVDHINILNDTID